MQNIEISNQDRHTSTSDGSLKWKLNSLNTCFPKNYTLECDHRTNNLSFNIYFHYEMRMIKIDFTFPFQCNRISSEIPHLQQLRTLPIN